MGKCIGIDLGTTNSCVAYYDGTEAKVIPNKEGKNTTPSIVAFTDKGEVLVGDTAKRQAITNPERTIFSIKRIMGLMMSEEKANEAQTKAPYKIVNLNGVCAIQIADKTYTPQEISAKILMKLKEDAEAFLGEKVTDAVITVPAYFNDAQRKATKDAGKIADLNVLRIINEPTAAALAYGIDKKSSEMIYVFDAGGGTFDNTILEIGDGVIEVKATDGDAFLGGDDYSNVIIDWLASEFASESGIDIKLDKMAHQRLLDAAETAKKELSSSLETEINLPFITADASGPKHLVKKLTRAKFESLTDHLTQKMLKFIPLTLKDAGVDISQINEVVMVGGTTRIPKIQDEVKKLFGKELNKSVNPDEVVAIGAAIQGGVLSGDVKDVLLLDVIPLSLGIETLGGVMTKLIDKNTTIPVKKSQTFSTATDNQPAVTVVIGQGEREFMKDNKLLGTFELGGIAPAPRGTPQIKISLDIDANGILNVSAVDTATGKENSIKISNSSGLSKEDIDRMVRDAEAHRAEDSVRKTTVETRNRLDNVIGQAEKFITENETKCDTSSIKENVNKAKQAMQNDAKNEELEAYERAIVAGLQNSSNSQQSTGSHNDAYESHDKKYDKKDEDVIDVEAE